MSDFPSKRPNSGAKFFTFVLHLSRMNCIAIGSSCQIEKITKNQCVAGLKNEMVLMHFIPFFFSFSFRILSKSCYIHVVWFILFPYKKCRNNKTQASLLKTKLIKIRVKNSQYIYLCMNFMCQWIALVFLGFYTS